MYMLFNHYLKRDSKRDIPLYFAKSLMYIGLVISVYKRAEHSVYVFHQRQINYQHSHKNEHYIEEMQFFVGSFYKSQSQRYSAAYRSKDDTEPEPL